MPQISPAHKCICTKPALEFSGSYIPPAKIHLIAVLIAQKIRCEPSMESMVTSPSRGYALKPCSRLRFILIIHQQFPPWQVPEALHRFRQFFLRLGHHMHRTMYLCGGILPILAIMLPPEHLDHLHGAVWAGRGHVIDKQRSQALLEHRDIFLGEARLLRQLDVSRSLDLVKAEPHKVLHGHGIRGLL